MEAQTGAVVRKQTRQPAESAQAVLCGRILRHLSLWPSTAAELVDAFKASHEDIHAAIAALESADRIEMHGKNESGLRVWFARQLPAGREVQEKSMKARLTDRQYQVMAVLRRAVREKGDWPLQKVLADRMGCSQPNVMSHLKRLCAAGRLVRVSQGEYRFIEEQRA